MDETGTRKWKHGVPEPDVVVRTDVECALFVFWSEWLFCWDEFLFLRKGRGVEGDPNLVTCPPVRSTDDARCVTPRVEGATELSPFGSFETSRSEV